MKKLNVKLFTKIINLLLSDKVKNAFFRFDRMDSKEDSQGCGCALYHARVHGILEDRKASNGSTEFYDDELGVPEKDYEKIFGNQESDRDLLHDDEYPTKEEVAQTMEDYVSAVEDGQVPGVKI